MILYKVETVAVRRLIITTYVYLLYYYIQQFQHESYNFFANMPGFYNKYELLTQHGCHLIVTTTPFSTHSPGVVPVVRRSLFIQE